MKRAVALGVWAALAGAGWGGLAPKEAYQPIIDAKPFGEIAAEASTDTAALAVQQKQKEAIAQKFRMCGITDMPDGSRKIAFLDETGGQVASYLLGVGESQNGFTLLSADYDREYATLSKDGLTLTLGLGKGLIDKPPEESFSQPEVALIDAKGASNAKPPAAGKQRLSFKQRLLQRQAQREEAQRSEAKRTQPAASDEALAKAQAAQARRQQIERIKQGLAPTVPIVLTPEEDAELEAAGVFAERPAQAPETPPEPAAAQEGAQPMLQQIQQQEEAL